MTKDYMKFVFKWSFDKVRRMCIDNDFYICGDNEDYSKMLTYVTNHEEPDEDDLLTVASDILRHSDEDVKENFTVKDIVEVLLNTAGHITVSKVIDEKND